MTSGGSFTFGQTGQSSQFGGSLFGQSMTNQPSFNFGASNAPNTTSFSFPSFGSTITTSSSAPAFGSTLAPFTFTNPSTTTSSFNFGGLNQFGAQQTNTQSLFGAQQQRAQQPFSFTTSLPQQQLQAQPQPQQTPNVFAPKIYNDERDETIGQFNRIQAFWGNGKAYYSAFMPPVDINQSEPLHRFKTIGYSEYRKTDSESVSDNKIGILVKMTGDESQLKTSLLSYEANIKALIGANFNVKFEITKILPENKAVISMSVIDLSVNKNIPSVQLQTFLNQTNIKTQLNNIFGNTFLSIVPLSPISKQELEEYLNTPPKGIDERLWNQAKLENPDPNRFIPVPLVGFAALNERFKLQERETQQHKMRLKVLTDDATALETNVTETKSKLDECKRKHIALSNRLLKILIAQEVIRKRGYPIQAEEDQLRAKLENIESELSAPNKFQGCINEMMSQLRQMQNQNQFGVSVSLDGSTLNDIKAFLLQEQEGISHLISILKQNIIEFEKLKNERQPTNV